MRGRTVFTLHPHQNLFNIPASAAVVLPENLPPQRAVLAANMETALNAVWDAAPGPADRIAIVGAGVVGSLVAYLCGRIPGAEVTLVDINPARAELAGALGVGFAEPGIGQGRLRPRGSRQRQCRPGSRTALELAGEEATVLEMSWYGDAPVTATLGGPFHSRRLRLISSQVGQIAPSHRPRWSHGRRLAAAARTADRCTSRRFAGAGGVVSRSRRGGCPKFLTPGMASFANSSLTLKEPPCSPLKFAITS